MLNGKTTNSLPSALATFGALLLPLAILSGALKFWDGTGVYIYPSGTIGAALALICCVAAWILNRRTLSGLRWGSFGIVLVLILFLCSDWLTRSDSLLVGPWIRGEVLLGAILFLVLNPRLRIVALWALLIIAPLVLLASFLTEASGRLLFSDDHSSVLYRLYLLKENFPNIPFYNPTWNAGWDSRDFFATGILNLFFLFSPLIYFFEVDKIYTLIVALVGFILIPGSLYTAARISGESRLSSGIASLLGLTLSLNLYRWMLQYGSMGFVTSMALIPITFALTALTLEKNDLSFRQAVALVASASLVLCWSPTAIIFIPAVIWGVLKTKSLIRKKRVIGSVLALLLINIPVIVIFVSVSRVASFVSVSKAPSGLEQATAAQVESPEIVQERRDLDNRVVKGMGKKLTAKEALTHLREEAVRSNPLILVLILPALALGVRKGYGKLLAPTFAFILVVSMVVSVLKPQLEFERLLLISLVLSTVPIASMLEAYFLRPAVDFGWRRTIPGAVVFGVLIAGLFSSAYHLRNRGVQQYYFGSPTIAGISEAIKANVGDGRALFPGFVLHELSQGHLAPLGIFTGKQLVASSPYHNLWWYTDQVPNYYHKIGPDGIEQYFDLMNASLIITHERDWLKYLDRRKGKYRRIWQGGKFTMYQRLGFLSNYLLEGQGSLISQDTNSVKFKIESASAVLKFTWFPFLRSSSCEIAPKELPGDIKFIELKNCPLGAEVTIDSVPVWKRVFG